MIKSPVSLQNLLLSGQSLRGIARQTGLDYRRLSEYARGVKLTPASVRDTLSSYWRQINYQRLRDAGLSAEQARQARDFSFSRSQDTIEGIKRLIKDIQERNVRLGYKYATEEEIKQKIRKSHKDIVEIMGS